MKVVNNCYYAHSSCKRDILNICDECDRKPILTIFKRFNTRDVVKYDKKRHILTIIACRDFNNVHEPEVSSIITVHLDSLQISYRKCSTSNPPVYHKKELMVHNDYIKFDLNKARQRTKMLDELINRTGVNRHQIGRKQFWHKFLTDNNVAI